MCACLDVLPPPREAGRLPDGRDPRIGVRRLRAARKESKTMRVSSVRCERCGGELIGPPADAPRATPDDGFATLDDLAAAVWVQAYDAAWLGRDWAALEQYLAPEVTLLTPRFAAATCGRAAVMAHMRALMCGVQVHEYNATDLTGHASGPVGVITYRWQLDWSLDGQRQALTGRDILVLRGTPAGWQLVWRVQVRA
jgi:ketosteroid isomerase-like protein